jgi:hypothetical protein
LLKGGHADRKQALATCFVDWRLRTIRNDDAESMLTGGDRHRQPRWAAADYENVS